MNIKNFTLNMYIPIKILITDFFYHLLTILFLCAAFAFIALFILHKNVKELQNSGVLMKLCLQTIPSITELFSYLNEKIISSLRPFELALLVTAIENLEKRKKSSRKL